MKDDLQIIINSPEESYDTDSAIDYIEIDRSKLFESYERNMPNLEKKDAKIAHAAKNIALKVENNLKIEMKKHNFVSELSDAVKEYILLTRRELTNLQYLLRDSKTSSVFYKMIN